MGDGTEPIPLLDAATIQRYQREIMQSPNRTDLNAITRSIWRYYDAPKNAAGLRQLRTAIEAKREILTRNDPR
jgi:hypothetical protein